jgi:hypothetical protein
MTTRRKFFGLMAAAPIAAPAIFDGGFRFVPPAPGERITINSSLHLKRGSDWSKARIGTITRMDGKPMRFAEEDAAIVPNRLYGAQVTASGDVI